MPEPWQLTVIIASSFACWYAAASVFDRRQARRHAADRAMNEVLLEALRELFEQRDQHTKEQ